MTTDPDTLLVGTRKGLLMFRRRNGAFELETLSHRGLPVQYAINDPRNGYLWASVEHGHWGAKLYRSEDFGRSWRELDAPRYPEGSEVKPGVAASNKMMWVLQPGLEQTPGRLLVGTEPGGLFVSEDDGESFSLNGPLWDDPSRREGLWFGGGRDDAAIHSIVLDRADPDHFYVAVSCAGVFETRDGGASWKPRNSGLSADFLPDPAVEVGHDPHLLVASPADPKVMWQQNHCGIFRSTDGGERWTEVSEEGGPASFGFAIAAADDDPDTAWVVPAEADECRTTIGDALFVCRTTDGGKSWDKLTDGLPQSGAFDLVFRHALDVSGDRLVFGSTTGNLFVSDDRGESWQCVSHHLPPIYSARFARTG